METQKYTTNINFYTEITSTKTKHSNILVSVILLFTNEHYRKMNKGKKEKRKTIKNNKKKKNNKNKTNQNKPEIKLITPALPPLLLRIQYQSIM